MNRPTRQDTLDTIADALRVGRSPRETDVGYSQTLGLIAVAKAILATGCIEPEQVDRVGHFVPPAAWAEFSIEFTPVSIVGSEHKQYQFHIWSTTLNKRIESFTTLSDAIIHRDFLIANYDTKAG